MCVCVCVADIPAGEPRVAALHGEPDVDQQDGGLGPGLQAEGGGGPAEGHGAGERRAQTEGSVSVSFRHALAALTHVFKVKKQNNLNQLPQKFTPHTHRPAPAPSLLPPVHRNVVVVCLQPGFTGVYYSCRSRFVLT